MTDPAQFRRLVIAPTLQDLGLWSLAAEQLLIGTALTESGLIYLTQHGGGPARGFYQIEPSTAEDLYDNWLVYRPDWAAKLNRLIVPGEKLADQLVTNLQYTTAIARLHYYRVPKPLPKTGDVRGMARYWKEFFNTRAGKGRMADFIRKASRHLKRNREMARKPSIGIPPVPTPPRLKLWTPTKGKAYVKWLPGDEFEVVARKYGVPINKGGFAVWGNKWWQPNLIFLRASHLHLFAEEAQHIETRSNFHED